MRATHHTASAKSLGKVNKYVCMYVWMDGWMDVCMDGWMYVCVYIYIYIYTIYIIILLGAQGAHNYTHNYEEPVNYNLL